MLISPDSVEKIKCSSCTFGNKMVFTFTSILNDNKIENELSIVKGVPAADDMNAA